MWKRTEITINSIKCDECGDCMEAMWEEIEDCRNQRSTIFHCWRCSANRELIREYDSNGNETISFVRRYFFG